MEETRKAVVSRGTEATVTIEQQVKAQIEKGFLVLLGIGPDDTEEDALKLADKICGVRVFEDNEGKMNRNLEQAGGQLLVVSQFTLYANLKSRRPGFSGAAKPDVAIPLYEKFISACRNEGFHVEHGQFGADMKVASVNDGPVTLLFDTQN